MNKKKTQEKEDFQNYLSDQLKNPMIKKYYDESGKQLEVAYRILKLRKQKGMSQVELAKKIGTKQSNVARIEAGQQNFSVDTLEKIAKAFGCDLKIDFV